jgi:hypothetical protein
VLLLALLGCRASGEQPDSFGFIADCGDGDWEACRRRHNASDRASVESFQRMFDQAFAEVFAYSTSSKTVEPSAYERLIVRDPLHAFLFQAEPVQLGAREVRVIRTSAETFATISKITIARHLPDLEGFNEEWLARYMLYIRKTPDESAIVDPLRASGLVRATGNMNKGVPDFTDALKQGINDTHIVMTFLVAHELYHFDHPFSCSGSTLECEALRKAHEAGADAFAIDVLAKLAAKDPTPDYLLGLPTYVFSQLMLVLQGARVAIAPKTHPPDHERLRSAALTLEQWVNAHPDNPAAAGLRDMANLALKIVKDIDAEGPTAYFQVIDNEASDVTLASLKVF